MTNLTNSVRNTMAIAFRRAFGIVSLLLVMLTVTVAQGRRSVTDGSTPLGLTSGAPAGSYALSDFDNINLFNGNLNFALPLLPVGGRGEAGHTITLQINRQWQVDHFTLPDGRTLDVPTDRPSVIHPGYSPGMLIGRRVEVNTCDLGSSGGGVIESLTRLTFIAPDGTGYELRDQPGNGNIRSVFCLSPPTPVLRGSLFGTADGTSITFVSDTPIYDGATSLIFPSGHLTFPNGLRYRIDNGLVTSMRDRNGNRLTFTYNNFRLISITDSLNRQVTITYGVSDVAPYGVCDHITFKGFGGASRTIRVSITNLGNALRSGFTVQTYGQLFWENLDGSTSTLYNPGVYSAVWLPDGRSYQLRYNSYGELARVVLPTGGAIEYDHDAGISGGLSNGAFSARNAQGLTTVEIYRRVVSRRVYPDGGAGDSYESLTAYSRPESVFPGGGTVGSNLGYVDVDHYGPQPTGALLTRARHYFYGSPGDSFGLLPLEYPPWRDGREYQTESIDPNGTTLRRVTHTWQQRTTAGGWSGDPNLGRSKDPHIVETTTTLVDTNQVSKQSAINPFIGSVGIDQYNNQTDVWAYGFGIGAPGPLIRRTQTTYLTNNPYQGNIDYATDTNIHIRKLPVQKLVYDASGNVRSHTDFIYDYYGALPLVGRSGIVQHDGAFHTGYGTRGNLTGMILRNPGGSPSEIHMHNQYDIAGSLVKAVDGRGIPTDYDFNDRFDSSPDDEAQSNSGAPELAGGFTYAFPTKVTNFLGHTAYIQYDYYLGTPVNTQDANGFVSSVTYNDALDRPTQNIQARYNVGGWVPIERRQATITYDDANRVITTTSDLNTFNDNVLITKAYYDSLGRAWRGASHEGGSWSIADTKFDALGRVSQVSNPYRAADPGSASPPSGLWTTTDYDALGRMIRATTPDGAQVNTAYNGNQTTVTDSAGKTRRTVTDAAGRLVKVTEAPGAKNYETTYLYDALDNLRKVTQGTQTRWFAYDFFSRLTHAKNPEQNTNSSLVYTDPVTGASGWSMAYKYDENSNLKEKIDARGVKTSYDYDALNRNTVTNYTNISQTRSVEVFYDGAANGKGRLHYERTKEGGVNSTETKINTYDALGRPRNKHQSFWRGSDWGTPYVIQQSYDLAGNVKSLTYPSGHTVNYSHDQAGRLSSFNGNLGGLPNTPYANTISYSAAGQMIKEQFGTNTRLYNNLHYNNRQQLVDIRVGDSATDEWNSNRGAFAFFYGTTAVTSGNQFANDTDNNGNLRRQITHVPLAGGGVIPQLHDYTYDPLNRIATVRERQVNQSGQWSDSVSQAYSYDQWGNRTLDLSGGSGDEEVWFDDAVPAGAVAEGTGGDSWNWVSSSPEPQSGSVSHISNLADWSNWSPAPYSGNVSHQSNISSGLSQHYYYASPAPVPVRYGGKLYAHIYIDPLNPPEEVMLQWGTTTDWMEHRAYWGANIIGWGTPDTASRRYMGPLPAAGGWVRLEVPASAVGLEGLSVNAMAFTLYGGRANWDLAGISGVNVWYEPRCDWNGWDYDCYEIRHDDPENYVLVDDSFPAGAASGADGGDGWNWRGANNVELIHQHYFYNASDTLQINAGDKLFTWVYLDPANPPEELMLQWKVNEYWEYRAYWGANKIDWGADGTRARRYMGPLPQAGAWVKLEIPASEVELEGKVVSGMAFTLYGGRAAWDKTGKVGPPPLAGAGPPISNRVYTVDTATNRLQPPAGSGTMQYDAAGNLEIDPYTTGVSQRFVYDSENRMVEAYNGAVRVSWYVYDAGGKRVVRTVGSQTTWQIYGCEGELLAEYVAGSSSSAPQKEYGYRNGQMLVVWDGSETGDKQLQWLVQDHLGSTRMVVDRSGSPAGIKRHDYAPFGEELSAGIRSEALGYGADSVRQKFGSKDRDIETGLDFFQARYFSSAQGRFTSPDEFTGGPTELFAEVAAHNPTFYADIFEPQSLNKYAYCLGNPLKFVDPDGHQATIPDRLKESVDQIKQAGRDLITGIGKEVANTYIDLKNTSPFVTSGPTAYYEPNGFFQELGMVITGDVLFFGSFLGGRTPPNVAMAQGKQAANISANVLESTARAQLEKRFIVTAGRDITKTEAMADFIAVAKSGKSAVVQEVTTGADKSVSTIRAQLEGGIDHLIKQGFKGAIKPQVRVTDRRLYSQLQKELKSVRGRNVNLILDGQ